MQYAKFLCKISVFGLWLSIFLVAVPFAESQTIPSAESVLGFQVGDDFKLATYDESLNYFQQLDAASDRITMVHIGRTSEGRDWYFALISSPQNLVEVERYRTIGQRLAHPADLTDAEARQLARDGIDIRENIDIKGVEKTPGGIAVALKGRDGGSRAATVEGSHILVATGRRPNVDGLALEKAGIHYSAKGAAVLADYLYDRLYKRKGFSICSEQ